MVQRVASGWIVRVGKTTKGPYYSLSYAEARDKELSAEKRRMERKQRRSCI